LDPRPSWSVGKMMPREALDPKFTWKRIDPVTMNPYGLYHIVGNVSEWVSDWYGTNYYTEIVWDNPAGPEKGTEHAFRGASYLCADAALSTTFSRRRPDSDALKRGVDKTGKPMIGIRGLKELPEIR